MKPTPALSVRLRFSTKDVGKGFYRGNRTGSMGAHTSKGGYIIDYRKVRNYNVPDLKKFELTPFVSRDVSEHEQPEVIYDWERDNSEIYTDEVTAKDLSVARRTRAMKFLREWRQTNPYEFQDYVAHQQPELNTILERARNGERVEVLENLKQAKRQGLQFEDLQVAERHLV